eukprot:scaffold145_cov54-Attheya_sp.AAC.2
MVTELATDDPLEGPPPAWARADLAAYEFDMVPLAYCNRFLSELGSAGFNGVLYVRSSESRAAANNVSSNDPPILDWLARLSLASYDRN